MNRDFQKELARWGPDVIGPAGTDTAGDASGSADAASGSVVEAVEYCRQLARSHYENFPLVSWMLPRRLQQHFYNIYAFCRWADDLADEIDGLDRSLELLGWWREQLWNCYQGTAAHPVFIALRATIQEFQIPMQPFEDLISAFEQDQRILEYESFEQLLDYCRRSANPVGRLVLHLCRQHDERNSGWSDSVCTGLQLANFWQDVSRDAEIGRVYLPKEDRDRFGYSDTDLRNRVTNDAFVDLMKFEVERAREFLAPVFSLAEQMPGRLQVDIEMFGRGGLKILDQIERIGYCVWDQRPIVTKRDVRGMFCGSVIRALLNKLGLRTRTIPAVSLRESRNQ